MEIIAYIIIGLAFSGLATYSVWWLFLSKESIYKLSDMGNYNESNISLERRLEQLEGRRAQLEAELVNNYSEEKLREINILDHRIRVCRERITGQWKKDVEEVTVTGMYNGNYIR